MRDMRDMRDYAKEVSSTKWGKPLLNEKSYVTILSP